MDGVSRALGVGPTIKLRGKSYQVNGRILRHYAEIEAEVIRLRGNPFEMIPMAREALVGDPITLRAVMSEVFREAKNWRFMSLSDLNNFLNSWRGECMQLWLAIRHNDPALTLDFVIGMYGDEVEDHLKSCETTEEFQEWKESIADAIAQASGEDELGNSTRSVPSPLEPNETTTAP